MTKTKKSTKEWLEAIQTCKKSGLSVKRWCSENGCSLKSYYYWHKK